MKRFFTALLLASLLGTGTQSVPAFATTNHVENLMELRNERLLSRLLRWQDLCDRRAERREARLLVRGIPSPLSSSDADRACSAIATRLRALGITTPASSSSSSSSASSSPNPNPNPLSLLPNQLFQPKYPLPVIEIRSRFLLLGETGQVVGSITLNPQDEPVEVREIEITLDTAVESLSSLEVFDEVGYILGSAVRNLTASSSGNIYTLSLNPDTAYFVDENDAVIVAFRPRLKNDDSGGESGESLRITGVDVTAMGQWSSRENLVETTGPDFKEHSVAYTTIEKVENAGEAKSTFATGTSKRIATFRFTAREVADNDANPRLTAITFSVSKSSDVSLANAELRDPVAGTETSCTVGSSTITCSAIPADVGSIESPRELVLYADVSVSGAGADPFLQIEINQAGGPSSAGDITWTDGTTSFSWVPLSQPVATGTSWE